TARSKVVANRLVVKDTKARGSGFNGLGIAVYAGAQLELDGAAVIGSRQAGVEVNDVRGDGGAISEATLKHLVVRDTKFDTLGQGGPGIACGGKLTVIDATLQDNHEFGVIVGNPGST